MNAICFDVGGTRIKHAYIEEGRIIRKSECQSVAENEGQFIALLVAIIADYEQAYEFQGVGISFPGIIDPSQGKAIFAGALENIHGINVVGLLSQALKKRYPVYLENDANCAAMAEKLNGNAQNNQTFMVMTIGTGIGGGLFINNQIYRGSHFRSGEFGMMTLDQTPHFNRVFHQFGSSQTLIETYKQVKGLAADELIQGQQVFDAYGEADVAPLIDEWADYLASGILNIVSVLDPEKVLIGGGVSANPFLLSIITKALHRKPAWLDFQVPIESCYHRNEAGLLGAFYAVTTALAANVSGK